MSDRKSRKVATKWVEAAAVAIEFEIEAQKDLFRYHKNIGKGLDAIGLDSHSWARGMEAVQDKWKPLSKLNSLDKITKVLGSATSAIAAAINEYEDGSAIRAVTKGVAAGTVSIGVTLLLSGTALPALAVFGLGLGLGFVAQKAAGKIVDFTLDTLGLGFDTKIDFLELGFSGLHTGSDKTDLIKGSDSADVISAKAKGDKVLGRGGDDELRGDGGNDILKGQDGDDFLIGGRGADVLVGGADNDVLLGEGIGGSDRKNDKLFGGAGDDFLDGGGGKVNRFGAGGDVLKGGGGNDVFVYRSGTGKVDGGSGRDVVIAAVKSLDVSNGRFSGIEEYRLKGLNGGDVAKKFIGSKKSETVYDNKLDNEIIGGGGHDTLHSTEGSDTLKGGRGNDIIELSSLGASNAVGGAGSDTFIIERGFEHTINGGKGYDILDLRGLNLNEVNFQNFKNIEEVLVDGVFLTDKPLSFEQVRVFGEHSLLLSDSPDGSVGKYLFGGAAFDIEARGAVELRFQASKELGFLKDNWDIKNEVDFINEVISDRSFDLPTWMYRKEDFFDFGGSTIAQTTVEANVGTSSGEYLDYRAHISESINLGTYVPGSLAAPLGIDGVDRLGLVFSWDKSSGSDILGDMSLLSQIPYDFPDEVYPDVDETSAPITLAFSSDVTVNGFSQYYPLTIEASDTPGELLAVFG